jgi:aspartyl-tRNA synthetase
MRELTRTHNTEQVIAAPIGARATLMGWVHHRRDFGQLIFITLRDRWGELQCVFDPEHDAQAHTVAETLRSEYVVAFSGATRPRPEKEVRTYPGGDREFIVDSAAVLNAAEPPPFQVEDDVKASEELRLKYRYIDLRRRPMVRALTMRHKAISAIRTYLNSQDFLEVETPILARSTPEGARDYVVPSRQHPGSFYALPQSPQLFKQILMCGGIDRYYQIAKCLRDEDLRGNRQPEHTQLDLEMSFASRDELFAISEGAMSAVWRECLGEELQTPFLHMSYDEAMRRFGSDKPDLRFGSEIVDLTEHFGETTAGFVRAGLDAGQRVHGVFIPGASLSRKQLDEWTAVAKSAGAGGLMIYESTGDLPKATTAMFVSRQSFEAITITENNKPESCKGVVRKEIMQYLNQSSMRQWVQDAQTLFEKLDMRNTDFTSNLMWLPFQPVFIDEFEELTRSTAEEYMQRRAAINNANKSGQNIPFLLGQERLGTRKLLATLSSHDLLMAALIYLIDGRLALRKYLGLGTWFVILGEERRNLAVSGQLRLKLGQAFNLIDASRWEWLWVVDFPLYARDEATGEVAPAHHAFTSPLAADLPKLDSDDPEVLLSIRADNYDLVLNGTEMSSGSLRIFEPALQMQVLRKVGLSEAQIEERFGWFLAAYRYGAPPHRGYGQGLDRLVMSLLGVENIREVIAFPKTASAACPLTGAPAPIEDVQWRELGIKPQ